jgi:hypothetical protein
MNMKYILVAFILIISMISLGCVDKSSGDTSSQKNVSTGEQIQVTPTSNDGSNSDISGNEPVSESDNVGAADNESVPESDNVNTDDVGSVPTDSEPTSEVVNDTSVTETFKIGEQKTMLGANIKLVDITDYDNNTATISIDNVEYKYDPESDNIIIAKGIEIIDMSTLKEDKTAEITVDYESVPETGSTVVSDESTPSTSSSENDTSVTEIFKIGDQKNMLGANVKLVNIIDFNRNIVTLDIDNTEYKYDPESGTTIKAEVNGTTIEVVDLITVEEDNTAEITVDYVS